MKTNFALTILLTCLLTSCGKKTQVKGVVYSKHKIPVPDVSIILQQYKSSNYPERTYTNIAFTNNNGEYTYNERLPDRFSNELECTCDSGSAEGQIINVGKSNTIDIYLK